MKYRFIIFFLTILIANLLNAQAPSVEWSRSWGSPYGDYIHTMKPTSEGGYISIGLTENNGGDVLGYHGNPYLNDMWVVKLNSLGGIIWQKCLGGGSFEQGNDIVETKDGGYIAVGVSSSDDCYLPAKHRGTEYFIVKLNLAGETVWQKKFGGSQNSYAYSIDAVQGGGYVVAGFTEAADGDVTANHGGRDFWVIKIDDNGNLVWQKTYGGSGDEEAWKIKGTPDGGSIVVGYTESTNGDITGNHGKKDDWVIKLDASGAMQWQKCLGGSEADQAYSVQATADGGYAVAGVTSSNDGNVSGKHSVTPSSDFWLVKLSAVGNIAWQKCYGGNLNEIAFHLQVTADSGYILAGSAESSNGDLTCNAGQDDFWVLKVDGAGTIEWQKNIGGSAHDEAVAVLPSGDGGYVAGGNTCSQDVKTYHVPPRGNNGTCGDFWLVKLSGGPGETPSLTINTPTTTICQGSNANITASDKYAGINPFYAWTRTGVDVDDNQRAYNAKNLKDGDIITCTVKTNGGACETNRFTVSDTAIIKIANSTNPAITINPSSTNLCGCSRIDVIATIKNGGVAPAYNWVLNGVNTGQSKQRFSSFALNAGDVLECVYHDNMVCTAGNTITSNKIVFTGTNSTPAITIEANADTVCQGTRVKFVATAQNAGTNPIYAWMVNGTPTGSNTDTFSIAAPADEDVISCSVRVDSNFTCITANTAASNKITLSVTPKAIPAVSITATDTVVCAGNPITFTATTANAGAQPAYTWMLNGTVAGGNSNTYTAIFNDKDSINCAIQTDPLFTCSAATEAVSRKTGIHIRPGVNPTISIAASANNFCEGMYVTFTATALNTGSPATLQWKLNNTNTGLNGATYGNRHIANNDSIFCILQPGPDACSTKPLASNTLYMLVNDTPRITLNPLDTFIHAGVAVQLNTTVTGSIGQFKWQPSGLLADATLLSPTTVPLTSTTLYQLVVGSDKGCIAGKTALVHIIYPLLMPNAFTPNGDSHNDVFKIPHDTQFTLEGFSVYNRWGNKVFFTSNISRGWDGTINGNRATPGAYIYIITGKGIDGKTTTYKGTVLLIR